MIELRPQIQAFIASLVAAAGVPQLTLDILDTRPLRIAATLNVPGCTADEVKALITPRQFNDCWCQQWPVNMHGSCDIAAITTQDNAITLNIRFASVKIDG